MIVFFKNFNRTNRTLLSIQSVRYLYPEIKIYCLNLFLENENEYDNYLEYFREFNVNVFFDKKTYNFEASAAGLKNNGFYFTEGINKMFYLSQNKEKVLMLDEDSFFTTGETIRFLIENEFDLAYGTWPSPFPNSYEQINGSIICINTRTMKSIFPINERSEYIENLLGLDLFDKCVKLGLKTRLIPTRIYTNYGNDGIHTNDIEEIKKALTKANIPFK
jgi:hypothetical protein